MRKLVAYLIACFLVGQLVVDISLAQGVPAAGAVNPKKASRGYFNQNGGTAFNQGPISTVATTKVMDTLQSGDLGSPGPASPMNPQGGGGSGPPVIPTFPFELPPTLTPSGASPQIFCLKRTRSQKRGIPNSGEQNQLEYLCGARGCTAQVRVHIPQTATPHARARGRMKRGPLLSPRLNHRLAKEFSRFSQPVLLQPRTFQGYKISERFRFNGLEYLLNESSGQPYACLGTVCDVELGRSHHRSIANAKERDFQLCNRPRGKKRLSCRALSSGLAELHAKATASDSPSSRTLRSEILPRLAQIS